MGCNGIVESPSRILHRSHGRFQGLGFRVQAVQGLCLRF